MDAAPAPSSPLSPTPRTTLGRSPHRALSDRAALHALLGAGVVAHVGVVRADGPLVLPMAYGLDPDGPDEAGSLYLHGSVAARWLGAVVGHPACVSVTELDGIVAARSGMHHSMNYRSAVVLGRARLVEDPEERRRALDLVVDQLVPGRAATLRPATRKELAATIVLAVPLAEASVKARAGDPADDADDVAAGAWAGVLPLRREVGVPVSAADSHDRVPDDVRRLAEGPRG